MVVNGNSNTLPGFTEQDIVNIAISSVNSFMITYYFKYGMLNEYLKLHPEAFTSSSGCNSYSEVHEVEIKVRQPDVWKKKHKMSIPKWQR